MTMQQLVRRLNRLPEGEYYADKEKIFLATSRSKKEIRENDLISETYPVLSFLLDFCEAFDEYKYGLEYASGGRIRYIGTNDLNTLMITK